MTRQNFEIRPWSKFWCCEIRRRCGPPRELCESAWQPPRKMSPLRDRPQFRDGRRVQAALGAAPQAAGDAARDRQRDRRKRSRPKREREQAERREAAAVETAPPPRQNVVEAVRQRAAAEQWLTALKQRASRVCTASVYVMCRVDTAYNKSVWRSSYDVCVYV